VKALKDYYRDSKWHICDDQRMAPMSDQRPVNNFTCNGKFTAKAAIQKPK
jgi:hypothetical protein